MGRRSRMSILKRQRELKKAEKAAQKRARRHGVPIVEGLVEPKPTVSASDILGPSPDSSVDDDDDGDDADTDTEERPASRDGASQEEAK